MEQLNMENPQMNLDGTIKYLQFLHDIFVQTWFNKELRITKKVWEEGNFSQKLQDKLKYLDEWKTYATK